MDLTFFILLGILLLIVIVEGVIFWVSKKVKTVKFDERQKLIQGQGYKLAFLFTVIVGAFVAIWKSFFYININTTFLLYAIPMFGGSIFIAYCIWNDAYLGINENRMKFLLSELCVILMSITIVKGNVDLYGWNFLKTDSNFLEGVWFIMAICNTITFITLLVKMFADKLEKEE